MITACFRRVPGWHLMDGLKILDAVDRLSRTCAPAPESGTTTSSGAAWAAPARAPEVSVVIPAFNAGRYLAEAIDSVLAQVDADLELIVVDDGSTDDTPAVLARYGDRLRVIRQPNRGLAAARNAGAAGARGRWIALMDADDVCAPERIALQAQALRLHPQAVLCCSDFSAFDGQGTTSASHEARYYSMISGTSGGLDSLFGACGAVPLAAAPGEATVAVRCAAVHEQIAFGNFVHPPTAMLSRHAYERAGGFDEAIRYNSDWEFFTRLARLGDFLHIDRSLLAYRLSTSQMSSRSNNRGAGAEDLLIAASKVWAADPGLERRHPERMAATRREFLADAAGALSGHRRWAAFALLARAAAQGLPAREVLRTAARILAPRRVADALRRRRQGPLAALVGSSSEHGGFRVGLSTLPPIEALQADWTSLEQRSDASFFVSWHWIGRWLAHLPQPVPRALLRVEFEGRLVGLAIVCGAVQRRAGLAGGSRSLHVNCSGDPWLDELTIEYNGLLVEAGREEPALRAVIGHFAALPKWEEIFLDGWNRRELPPLDELAREGLVLVQRAARSCYRVDLRALRESERAYVASLPPKVRYKVRRTMRCAEEMGDTALDVAAGPQEATRFLHELSVLHQKSWQRRGKAGSFANSFFDAFHADLVGRAEDARSIQLVRMRVKGQAFAYLYNFVHRGRIYNYQSGFDFDLAQGAAWRPGVVCHAAAIEMNLEAGKDVYDFLAGDHVYKKELGVDSGEMSWLTLQRPRLKFRVETALKAWRLRWQVRRNQPGAADAVTSGEGD
jgi:glycosyltransferase involved in cell wall biosynthesis/CelD/BcsL family acetyltransferase involved in cellulose biosynthesis